MYGHLQEKENAIKKPNWIMKLCDRNLDWEPESLGCAKEISKHEPWKKT